MCGIVSLISRRQGGFYGNDLELFEQLLVLDTLRGLDSTGVFSVDNQRNVNSVKIASHPYHLFACDEWKSWRGRANSIGRILVGHNRKATKGTINSTNAHPFHENNIVLVHNGSLREDHKKSYADVEVDSHALAVAFAEKGAENILPNIDGAFALVWWDIAKERLFAIRNDERPLSLVASEDFFVMCSEPWMAQVLLSRHNKKIQGTIDIKPGMLYEFKLDGSFTASSKITLKDPYEQYTSRSQHGGASMPSVSHPKCETGCGTGQADESKQSSSTPSQTTTSQTLPSQSSTSLTLVKTNPQSMSPQHGGKDALPDEHTGHVSCGDYPKGKEVLVRFYESKLSETKQFNIMRGKSLEPGCEEVDVVAYLKAELFSGKKLVEAMNGPVLAKVVKHTTSLCGRSLYVNSVSIPDTVEVHNGRVSLHEWNYVMANCKCKKCEAPIYEEEQFFTGVSRKTNNKLAVTCPECIEDQLVGEYKHEFNQSRLAALQAAISKREELAGISANSTESANSPTLH